MRTYTVNIRYPYPEFDCPDDIMRFKLPITCTCMSLHMEIKRIAAQLRNDPDVSDNALDFLDTLLFELRRRIPGLECELVSASTTIYLEELMKGE